MKKLFLFTTLILAHFLSHSQTYKSIDKLLYKCEYQLTYQPDSNDRKSQKTENMLLLVGDSSSVFYSKNEYLKDSIYLAKQVWNLIPEEKIALNESIPKANIKYKIIKHQRSKETLFRENIFRDTFEYTEPSNQFNWEVLDSTKVILGYQCQKATTNFGGRAYEAWFSPELPISDGPYKFNGLPGLIISINDTKKQYNFQLVGFKSVQNQGILISKAKVFKTSKKTFIEKKLEFETAPFKAITQNNSSMTFSTGGSDVSAQEMDKLVQAELKKKNNPIELK